MANPKVSSEQNCVSAANALGRDFANSLFPGLRLMETLPVCELTAAQKKVEALLERIATPVIK